MLTALAEHRETPSWIIHSLSGLLWDHFMKFSCIAHIWNVLHDEPCTRRCRGGSYEVASGGGGGVAKAQSSAGELHVLPLKVNAFNLRGEPLWRTSSQSSRSGERGCQHSGWKDHTDQQVSNMANHYGWSDSACVLLNANGKSLVLLYKQEALVT